MFNEMISRRELMKLEPPAWRASSVRGARSFR